MKHIYGPVHSRRLGLSLGLSLTPYKTCSFDCVYCQLGRTTHWTKERSAYVDVREIIDELRDWLKSNAVEAAKLAYISLAGAGEPTLNTGISDLIREAKKLTATPVAILTNASLFTDPAVRAEVLDADLIIPSLDAVTPDVFNAIDRPVAGINIEGIIEGLIRLRAEFKHQLWLEVMIVRGINDQAGHIEKLKCIIARINPDKIQLNSPVRIPAECDIEAADRAVLENIKATLGPKCEIV